MKKHLGFTIWFTGLPCCGKTTIANQVAVILKKRNYLVEQLDGDLIRQNFSSDLSFSKKDRDENIKRATFLAKMLSRNNVVVLASFVSPYRKQRRRARKEIKNFVEVYVRCPVKICMKRDVKGMYQESSWKGKYSISQVLMIRMKSQSIQSSSSIPISSLSKKVLGRCYRKSRNSGI